MGCFLKDVVPIAVMAVVLLSQQYAVAGGSCDETLIAETQKFDSKWPDVVHSHGEFVRQGAVVLDAAPRLTAQQVSELHSHVDTMSQMMELRRGEISGRNLAELLLPEDIGAAIRNWTEYMTAVAGQPIVAIEIRTERGRWVRGHVHRRSDISSGTAAVSFGDQGSYYVLNGVRHGTPAQATLLFRDGEDGIFHGSPPKRWRVYRPKRVLILLAFAPKTSPRQR